MPPLYIIPLHLPLYKTNNTKNTKPGEVKEKGCHTSSTEFAISQSEQNLGPRVILNSSEALSETRPYLNWLPQLSKISFHGSLHLMVAFSVCATWLTVINNSLQRLVISIWLMSQVSPLRHLNPYLMTERDLSSFSSTGDWLPKTADIYW